MADHLIRRIGQEEFMSQDMKASWTELVGQSVFSDTGLTWSWATTWWSFFSSYGAGRKELFVLTYMEGEELKGIAPFMLRTMLGIRILEFIGQSGGATTDYTGFVVKQGPLNNFYLHLNSWLIDHKGEWDVINLVLPGSEEIYSEQLASIREFRTKQLLRYRLSVADEYSRIELPAVFEQYVQSLGRRTRTDMRQYLRIASSVQSDLQIMQGPAMKDHFGDLVTLNKQNWGYFNDDLIRRFYEAEVNETGSDDRGPFLARLNIGAEPVAMVQGYFHRETCFLHTSGVKRQMVSGLSPGLTLYGLLIRELIGRGYRVLDLSPGLEDYKLRLGVGIHPLQRLEIFKPGLVRQHYKAILFLRRGYRGISYLAKTGVAKLTRITT